MSVFTAQLVRDWTGKIHPNLRRTYVSVVDATGWFIYNNTQKLSSEWIRKWESNGVTGPANSGDTTQRLTSVAECSVRGATTATAQSWGCYQNSDGVQLLIGFTGASDDIVRIAYSPGGLYTLAGTTTFLPTATDEVVISNANSIVNSTASLDRTMTIWCHDKDWRCVVFRNGSMIRALYLVEVESLASETVFGRAGYPAYVGGHATSGARGPSSQIAGGVFATAIGSAGDTYPRCRVFTFATGRNIKIGGGEISALGINVSLGYANNPGNSTGPMGSTAALQGNKTIMVPIFWSGDGTGSVSDGYLGIPRDWKLALINSLSAPSTNDFLDGLDPTDTPGVTSPRTNWWASFGGPLLTWPWRNAAASVDTGL